jgi:hypothetical protein
MERRDSMHLHRKFNRAAILVHLRLNKFERNGCFIRCNLPAAAASTLFLFDLYFFSVCLPRSSVVDIQKKIKVKQE